MSSESFSVTPSISRSFSTTSPYLTGSGTFFASFSASSQGGLGATGEFSSSFSLAVGTIFPFIPQVVPANQEVTPTVVTTPALTLVRQREIFATKQAAQYSNEALEWFGEQVIVRLLWRAEDVDAGKTTLCLDCQDTPLLQQPNLSVQMRVQAAYRQGGNSWCRTCFGTSFTGGFQPIIYQLYMLALDTPQKRIWDQTGRMFQERPKVQFYAQPQIRTGDLVIRITDWDVTNNIPLGSGERFVCNTVQPQTLRTGPGNATDAVIQIAQTANLFNIPQDNILYQVPFIP